MRKDKLKIITMLALVFLMCFGCAKVPAGYVGVKVYLLGQNKGVDHEVLGTGRYYMGMNEELYLFPIFTQNYVWTQSITEQSKTDEAITFQTKEGMDVNTDIGISYSIDPAKVGVVFQKYRKGVDEITSVYLRSMVRDAFIQIGAQNPIESVYGEGKTKMLKDVQAYVSNQVKDIGIIVERIYLVGSMRLPKSVVTSLNLKIEATQKAQQRENEIRESEAEGKKKVVIAEAEATAKLTRAEAEAKSNLIVAKSLTPELVRYLIAQKWDGNLPQVTGGATPFISMDINKSGDTSK